jgi:hypothetical protein
MDKASSMNARDEECMQGFVGKTRRKVFTRKS